jgi:hypothetical protein
LSTGDAAAIIAVRAESHFLALGGGIPECYLWQCHHLLASGAPLLHYVSYCPQQENLRDRLAVVPLRPDANAEELLGREQLFWRCVVEGVPYAHTAKGFQSVLVLKVD